MRVGGKPVLRALQLLGPELPTANRLLFVTKGGVEVAGGGQRVDLARSFPIVESASQPGISHGLLRIANRRVRTGRAKPNSLA